MKSYPIGENFIINEYKDKTFAKWQISLVIDGVEKSLGNCFDSFYSALIFIGIIAKGCEINAAGHFMSFIQDAVTGQDYAKNSPVSHHYETLKEIDNI